MSVAVKKKQQLPSTFDKPIIKLHTITKSQNKTEETKPTKKYPDRGGSYEYDNKFFKYEGQWKNGKKHGHGKLVFLDSSFYEGMFNCGEITGYGFRYFAHTKCKYQGQFFKGELQGKGRMMWPDGSIYEGVWDNNKRHGFGIMKSVKENLIYRGEYVNNKRQGQGTMIYPLDCLRDLERLQSKGDRYDGDWQDNKRHGNGDMKFTDGTVYEGQFDDDKFNGHGFMHHASGIIYRGIWKEGAPTVLPTKLVIVNMSGTEPLEVIQGQPFDIQVQCVNEEGEITDVESCRQLRITAGFKHIKAKKGTALFDLIEEYEEKPMETPYYPVLQYPLTDFTTEDDTLEEDEETKDATDEAPTPSVHDTHNEAEDTLDQTDNKSDETKNSLEVEKGENITNTPRESPIPEGQEVTSTENPLPESEQPATAAPGSIEIPTQFTDGHPLPAPVTNKRTEKGVCEWQDIQLAQAPPKYPPFAALEEEDRKIRARQQRQDEDVEGKKKSVVGYNGNRGKRYSTAGFIEAKRLGRVKHDERYARIGEYVLMVQDVTSPPFMDQTLEPAYILLKHKKAKREKKKPEDKAKWDTKQHIASGMVNR